MHPFKRYRKPQNSAKPKVKRAITQLELCNHLDCEEKAGCFTLITFLMFCDS